MGVEAWGGAVVAGEQVQLVKRLDFVGLLLCCPRRDLGRELAGWLELVEGLGGENGGVSCYKSKFREG